jgi:hypothetical protein
MAAQFTSTNGLLARGDCRWIARATSSLPVPFSPVMSTRAGVPPTLSILSMTALEWLLENVVRAELRRLDRGLDRGMSADHDDRR